MAESVPFVQKAKLVLGGVVVGALIGAGAMLKPLLDTRAQVAQVEQQQTETAAALDAARARATLMQARVALARAQSEMDRRNFGTAQDHVNRASQALTSVDAASAGVDAEKFAAVRDKVSSLQIQVAEDMEPQRTAVAQAARELDALLPAS